MIQSSSTFVNAVESIEIINSIAGICLNAVLLYAIMRFSRPILGTYKHLLTIFALLDAYLVILHLVVHPRVLRAGNIHSIVSDTVFDDGRITSFWVGCQSLPFTLLGIHFLYRYWSVRHPHLIPHFSNKKFVSALVSVTLVSLFSWYFLCVFASSGHDISVALATMVAEYERKYGKRIENAWILMDQWRDNEYDWILIAITLLMNIIMITSVSLSCILAVLTFRHIQHSFKVSPRADQLQRKLLVALCAQSAVPMTFVYLPFLICINSAFLKMPSLFFHDLCVTEFTFFPVWDPAIIILLFTDYRRGLMSIFRKPPKQTPTTAQMTTIFVQSTSVAPSRAE